MIKLSESVWRDCKYLDENRNNFNLSFIFRLPLYQAQEMGEQLNNYWILAFLVRCFCKIYKLFKGSYHSWYFPFLPYSAYHRTAKNNCLIKWLIGYLSVCMKNLSLCHSAELSVAKMSKWFPKLPASIPCCRGCCWVVGYPARDCISSLSHI